MQKALTDVQQRLGKATAAGYRNFPEGEGLRLQAHEIRANAIDNLDILLETLADNVRKNGGKVFFAADETEAVQYCLTVARKHNVKQVVKGKSMVTEEIGLNDALQTAGIEVNETDLGEYIIQLAGEKPSHIVAPAIHKTREQVGQLFAEKLGTPYTNDPPVLTHYARKALREKFLTADMGISGCNLAVAETGHITTVSNEGNIRMATTMPKVHVAFMGMERIVARLEDHAVLLRLLSMGAAAQQLGGYVSYIGGPRQGNQVDGPEEFHLVILDNGRSRILADPELREALCCMRCGACLNVCPVYGKISGHSYGSPYSGPIGALITPLLAGINAAQDLCLGETLCGACKNACPVDINLPRMLLALRSKLADGDREWNVKRKSPTEKASYKLWSWMIQNRKLYDGMLSVSSALQKLFPKHMGMIRRLPFPLHGWTQSRDFKPIAEKSFMRHWREHRQQTEKTGKSL